MIPEFKTTIEGINDAIQKWEPILLSLSTETITSRFNSQNRNIKQILGHLIDSASNNTHRIIHLQNLPSPITYPNYASNGNNDRWISIQNYQHEDWHNLVQLWKYSNLHIMHVIANVNPDKMDNEWIASPEKNITLKTMVIDYLRHLELHISEIKELMG